MFAQTHSRVQTGGEANCNMMLKSKLGTVNTQNPCTNRSIVVKRTFSLNQFIPNSAATNKVRKSPSDSSSRGRENPADHRLQVYLSSSVHLVCINFPRLSGDLFFPQLVTFSYTEAPQTPLVSVVIARVTL